MSTSYTYYKQVFDCNNLRNYISKSLSTIVSAVTSDGLAVVISFTASLTSAQQTRLAALLNAYIESNCNGILTTNPNALANNISYTPLAANATFVGGWASIQDVTTLWVLLLTDQPSSIGGATIQFGYTSAQADVSAAFMVTNNYLSRQQFTCQEYKYARVVYQNGASAQTQFSLQVRLAQKPVPSQPQSVTASKAITSSAAYVPIMTVRNASQTQTSPGYTTIKLNELSVSARGDSGTITVVLVRSSALTGSTFNPVSTFSICSLDTVASSANNGTTVATKCVASNGAIRYELNSPSIILAAGETLTVACKLNSATTPAILSASLSWKEY